MNATRLDLKVLAGAGVALLSLAGFFLWRDLQLPVEAVVAIGALCSAAIALARVPRERPLAGPIALIGTTVLGGAWYALTREPVLLAALGVCVVASAVTVVRMHRTAVDDDDRLQLLLLWHGLTAAVLVASASFYFQFFTLGFAEEELGRRLVLTLVWIVTGLAFVFVAYNRAQPVIRDAGFGFIGVAVAKALLYDTVQLSGTLRIGGLAAAGVLLLLGAWVTSRVPLIRRSAS